MIDTGTNKQLQETADEVCQEQDKIIEFRTDAFKQIFDYAEENNVPLNGPEWAQLSGWVTNEVGINQKVSDLSDLQVEPDKMSKYEFTRIIKRARTGIKNLVEQRKRFVKEEIKVDGKVVEVKTFGPYFSNRQQRRALKIVKNPRASRRSVLASRIVDDIRNRRTV
jgi:hypothetical protein